MSVSTMHFLQSKRNQLHIFDLYSWKMSTWTRVENLPPPRRKTILDFYKQKPILFTIRSEFPQLVEARVGQYINEEFDIEKAEDIAHAGTFKEEVTREARRKLVTSNDLGPQRRLYELLGSLENFLELELFLDLQILLRRESFAFLYWEISDQAIWTSEGPSKVPGLLFEVRSHQVSMERVVGMLKERHGFLQERMGQYDHTSQRILNLQNGPNNVANDNYFLQRLINGKSELSTQIYSEMRGYFELEMEVLNTLRALLNSIIQCKTEILDATLKKWRRSQLLLEIGIKFQAWLTLDKIQEWSISLFQVILATIRSIYELQSLTILHREFYTPENRQTLPLLMAEVRSILQDLVSKSLVVQDCPNIIMKGQGKKKRITLRCILGQILLGSSVLGPCTAYFLKEDQLFSDLVQEKAFLDKVKDHYGTLNHSVEGFQVVQGQDVLLASFSNLTLTERKAIRNPLDVKGSLFFVSNVEIRVPGSEELIPVRMTAFSPPIIAIVNANQRVRALASIFWDSAFSQEGRTDFSAPEEVHWPEVAFALNALFRKKVNNNATSRDVSLDALIYLAEVLKISPCGKVSRSVLLEPLREAFEVRKFSLFGWFFEVMELLRGHLLLHWNQSSIYGFLGRQQVGEILRGKPPGTFLVRFSESELGAISISYVSNDHEVLSVIPFTTRDLQFQSLSSFVSAINELRVLYPDQNKNDHFPINNPNYPDRHNPPYVNPQRSLILLPRLNRLVDEQN